MRSAPEQETLPFEGERAAAQDDWAVRLADAGIIPPTRYGIDPVDTFPPIIRRRQIFQLFRRLLRRH